MKNKLLKLFNFQSQDLLTFLFINQIVAILLIVSLPNISIDDLITRIDRIQNNLFFLLGIIDEFDLANLIQNSCKTVDGIFKTFPSCYDSFDDNLRYKIYLENLTYFFFISLIISIVNRNKTDDFDLYKYLLIFPSFILLLFSLIHESSLTIFLLILLPLRNKILTTVVIGYIFLFGDIEFLLPAFIFIIILNSYHNKKIYGLISCLVILILFNNITVEFIKNFLIQDSYFEIMNAFERKYIETFNTNSIIGINNIPFTRLIYAITEILGNLGDTPLISSLTLFIIILFKAIKERNINFINNPDTFTFLSFLIIWPNILYNYTDIRFYPFMIFLLLKILKENFNLLFLKKLFLIVSAIMPLEILLRVYLN